MGNNRTNPSARASRFWLTASLLVLATSGCAGELDVWDAAAAGTSGAGSSGSEGGNGGSGASSANAESDNQDTSSTGGETDAATELCGTQTCAEGSHCFSPPPDGVADSICAPTCPVEPEQLRGQPCAPSVLGNEGVCAPDLAWVPGQNAVTQMGVCSVACDPLAPSCPENFVCSLALASPEPTEAPVPSMFACMPAFRSLPVGTLCYGWGDCVSGAECGDEFIGTICSKYCDTTNDACPEPQTCITQAWFPEESPVGLCADP